MSYVGLEPERFTVGRETPEVDLVLKEEPALMGEMEAVNVEGVFKTQKVYMRTGVVVEQVAPEGSVLVQGVVVDEEGQPLRGAEILQLGKGGEEELVDRTDEAGRFGAPVVLRRKRFKVAKEGYRARVVKAEKDEEKGFVWLRVVLEPEGR